MKVAICGQLQNVLQAWRSLQNSEIEVKFLIKDFLDDSGGCISNLPSITFFEFRWLINTSELDGVIVAADPRKSFIKDFVQTFKLYDVPHVGIIDYAHYYRPYPIYWLDKSKVFVPYLETDITDKCNLRCAACFHFANFPSREELHPIDIFKRDIQRISQICDVVTFRLMGGEPFLSKNLAEYVKISRQYLPRSSIVILSNGLLIPSLPQKILDTLRENSIAITISTYYPTLKIADKIKSVLESNGISYKFYKLFKNFKMFLTMHAGNDPIKSRAVCGNDTCRFLFNGKVYKCPLDALSYKLTAKFGIENYPAATGVDIFSPNFSSMLRMLDGNVEMCHWCTEEVREVPWRATTNPNLEDWLADPDELKNFQ